MNKWFYFNSIILLIASWKLFNRSDIGIHIWIGFIGLFLFLFNWTRHAVFSTIRDTPNRDRKIRFANLSKKVLPFHRWVGTTALLVVIIHAILVIQLWGWNWQNAKLVSGALTLAVLIAMVITGWMRLVKPTGKKRMAHLYLGLTLFFMIGLHILL